MVDGQTAAAKADKDPLAGLDTNDRKLVEQALKTYPGLTTEKAVEMLKAFGGI